MANFPAVTAKLGGGDGKLQGGSGLAQTVAREVFTSLHCQLKEGAGRLTEPRGQAYLEVQ